MFPHHARPRVTHHGLDLLPALAAVAVNRALGAGGFFRAEMAAIQPLIHVAREILAFRALSRCGLVMITAIDPDHGANSLPFPGQPLVRGDGT